MAYMHGTSTQITVFIDNVQHPLIIDSGSHCSKVAREYLDNHFLNWEKQLLPESGTNFKSASGKMISIGTIIKEIIIPHREGNIKLNLDFVLLEDAHIQGFLLRTEYQKLSLLKILRKNRPAFAIGVKSLGKIRGHDIELYLDFERSHPPMLRTPPYQEIPETRKDIEKNINELLDMDAIRKIGQNEIAEITTPVLYNYTKADRYPIPRIPHALDKLVTANT
ncbi:hypothetical protein O181_052875 [Austropuccinia psidii MF-1]|uniref:Uncharacterized protein n=1 Tax=Austropuccinia psidii MF-1 TaxID=1389203 RepID=A0A9Q3HT24_9BASI|nr:hypothetical protein [Austropuccinia psidii MF-1]